MMFVIKVNLCTTVIVIDGLTMEMISDFARFFSKKLIEYVLSTSTNKQY